MGRLGTREFQAVHGACHWQTRRPDPAVRLERTLSGERVHGGCLIWKGIVCGPPGGCTMISKSSFNARISRRSRCQGEKVRLFLASVCALLLCTSAALPAQAAPSNDIVKGQGAFI